eukprot:scaffold1295_cov220-Pinguiococcus_pyrenoidosus.AAC.7
MQKARSKQLSPPSFVSVRFFNKAFNLFFGYALRPPWGSTTTSTHLALALRPTHVVQPPRGCDRQPRSMTAPVFWRLCARVSVALLILPVLEVLGAHEVCAGFSRV